LLSIFKIPPNGNRHILTYLTIFVKGVVHRDDIDNNIGMFYIIGSPLQAMAEESP